MMLSFRYSSSERVSFQAVDEVIEDNRRDTHTPQNVRYRFAAPLFVDGPIACSAVSVLYESEFLNAA
jgi:hypothetical protein